MSETTTRLLATAGDERPVAYLRLGAALVTTLGSVWLLVVLPHRWWLALIGLAASAFWVRRAFAVLRLPRSARTELDLGEVALTIRLPSRDGVSERIVPWAHVRSVEVDEDFLVVRVAVSEGEPLVLEPVFPGVSVYALRDAVHTAWEAAPARSTG